jgi:hypothetical protein
MTDLSWDETIAGMLDSDAWLVWLPVLENTE